MSTKSLLLNSAGKKVRLRVSKENQTRRFTRSKVGNFFYILFIVAFGLFSTLPFIYCIATSFKPLDELMRFPPTFFVEKPTLANYLVLPSLLSNLRIPLSRYLFNSIFISAIGTMAYVVFGTMAGFVLARSEIKGKTAIFALIQFALLFNGYTLGIPRYLIYSWMGIIDTYWIILLPNIASTMGVFLMKQYMEGALPVALLEAARIDGAGPYRIFFQIATPIVKPCVLTLTLFGFRDIWSLAPDGGTIFSESLKTLASIMGQITQGGIARSGSAMAVTVILMIPPIIVYLVTQSNVVQSMSSAGIKG